MTVFEPTARVIEGRWTDKADFIRRCAPADAVLLTMDAPMDADVIRSCPRLKVIGKYGVGVENIDVETAAAMGIPVVNTPGANANATAELAVGLTLCLLRRIQKARVHMAAGGWKERSFIGGEIAGRRIGIIGYGDIGRRAAELFTAFHPREIRIHSQTRAGMPAPSPAVFTSLEELLRESDIVTVHKALTPEARGMLGHREFEMMKPGALLVNTSRGGLTDKAALIGALRSGRLGGAALDVFHQEPLPADDPLHGFQNVVLTPHIGGSTVESREQVVKAAATKIMNVLTGKGV